MDAQIALSIFDDRARFACPDCSGQALQEAREGVRREAEAVGNLDDFQARIIVDRYVRDLTNDKEGDAVSNTSIQEAVKRFRRRLNRSEDRDTEGRDEEQNTSPVTESGEVDMVEVMLEAYPQIPSDAQSRARELGQGICSCPSVARNKIEEALRESGYNDDLDTYVEDNY